MIVARICVSGQFHKAGDSCACRSDVGVRRSPLYKGVQIGFIDGETEGYFPPAAGPYVDPGNSLKRRVKNKKAWKEMIARSEGQIGDIS